MEINISETPFTIIINCNNNKLPRPLSMKVRKLEIKDGKIICPDCGEPLNGNVYIDL